MMTVQPAPRRARPGNGSLAILVGAGLSSGCVGTLYIGGSSVESPVPVCAHR